MRYKSTLAQLYPPVAYQVNGEQFLAQCEIDGNAFERLQQSAIEVLNVIEPETSRVMLADWERVCGIKSDPTKPYASRVKQVIIRLNAIGGLSIPYFKRLAESIGYQIEIKEFSHIKNDLPDAGDIPIQNSPREQLGYMWRVTVLNGDDNITRFRAGVSSAGERLTDFSDRIIEAFFQDLKPAHTYCYFAYR
ncbi:YmfQ family protein [Ursidibacter arcticus]